MTQIRITERKAPVNSFPLSRKLQGIIYHGRYKGFDTIQNVSGLNFEIAHAADGHLNYSEDTYTASTALGIWVTRQGLTIIEDAAITGLTCQTNASNAFQRIDALVGTHQYSNSVTGGNAATYSVIKGADGGPVAPTLASNQTLIGHIYVPASASNLSSATYVPAEVLGLSGIRFARMTAVNRYLAQQQDNEEATEIEITNTSSLGGGRDRQILQIPQPFTANSYRIKRNVANPGAYYKVQGLPAAPVGTRILLQVVDNSNTLTLESLQMNSTERAAGYQPIELPYNPGLFQHDTSKALEYGSIVELVSTVSPISAYNVWMVLNINTIYSKVLARQTALVIEGAGFPSAPLHTDARGNATSVYYYRDNNSRVYVAGEPIKFTATFNINTVIFSFGSGYRPYDNGSSHTAPISVTVPVRSTATSYSAPKCCTLEIQADGDVICTDYQFAADDYIDLRGLVNFLAD